MALCPGELQDVTISIKLPRSSVTYRMVLKPIMNSLLTDSDFCPKPVDQILLPFE